MGGNFLAAAFFNQQQWVDIMMRRIVVAVLAARVALAGLIMVGFMGGVAPSLAAEPEAGEPQITIFDIYDRFIASRSAAQACYLPSETEATQFGVNLIDITVRVHLRAKEIDASLDEENFTNFVAERTAELTQNIAALAQAEGCDSETLMGLVALYKFHAAISTMELKAGLDGGQ